MKMTKETQELLENAIFVALAEYDRYIVANHPDGELPEPLDSIIIDSLSAKMEIINAVVNRKLELGVTPWADRVDSEVKPRRTLERLQAIANQ